MRIGLILLLVIVTSTSFAQLNRKQVKRNNKAMSQFKGKKNNFTKQKRYYSLSVGINSMNYFGDIAPKSGILSTSISATRPGITASFGYRVGPRYTLQASLSYGTLFSDDNKAASPTGDVSKYRYVRNLQFKNNIAELALTAVFDLVANRGSYLSRAELTPYGIIGIAGFHHNPLAKVADTDVNTGAALPEAGQWVKLRPLGTEGQYATLSPTDANFGIEPYSLWQLSIPFGLGVRYKLGEALDISLDITFRYLFFDYIDDVSKNYINLDLLDSDLAVAMSDRSRETVGVLTGTNREDAINGLPTNTYNGYTVISGYGQEGPAGLPNKRGGSDNDLYYVTSIKIAYVIGSSFRKAKFR